MRPEWRIPRWQLGPLIIVGFALGACGEPGATDGSEPSDSMGATGPGSVASPSNGPPPNQRRSLIFDRLHHDAGSLHQGDEVTVEYQYHNRSGRAVRVKSLRGSCKCVIPSIDAERIEDGARGTVRLTFLSAGRKGEEVVNAFLLSDAPQAERIALNLRVTTLLPIEPAYSVFNLQLRQPGESVSDVLPIRLRSEVEQLRLEGEGDVSGWVAELAPIAEHRSALQFGFEVPRLPGTRSIDLELVGTLGDPWPGKEVRKPLMITWQVLAPLKIQPPNLILDGGDKTLRVVEQWQDFDYDVQVSVHGEGLTLELERERDRARIYRVVCPDPTRLPDDARLSFDSGIEGVDPVTVAVRAR